jgi:hypothetical protein
MPSPHGLIIAVDVIAILVMALGVYFPRHRRRDMVFAYIALNLGVVAVTSALATATVSAGLGLGLFGVLSIIRLRSSELSQQEVAYYFVALAMGLLGGLTLSPAWAGPALIGMLLAGMYVGDHPKLLGSYRHQQVTLDAAFTDEQALRERLELLLGAEVRHLVVDKVDLVRDTTVVDVRYRRVPGRPPEPRHRDLFPEIERPLGRPAPIPAADSSRHPSLDTPRTI